MASKRINKIRESKRLNRRTLKAMKSKVHARGKNVARRTADILADQIIGILHKLGGDGEFKKIISSLSTARGHGKEIKTALDDLCHLKYVLKIDRKTFRLNPRSFVEGELEVNPRGFGFVSPIKGNNLLPADQDLFIPGRALGTALHGDIVLVQITGGRHGKPEARVVKILNRSVRELAGIYSQESDGGFVVPDDNRYPFTIAIDGKSSSGAADGDAVLVEITDFGTESFQTKGTVSKVLGDPNSSQVQMKLVMCKFDLPHIFRKQSLEEADSCSDKVEVGPDRADLRDIFHVTIDGETARDFDDAVSVIKTKKGYRLYVSIADVSHYVQPETNLDKDAWERGTSIYFPTGVVPMLPERLSNNLCSLNPEVDRYAFTAVLDFDKSGNQQKIRFVKSVIRSRYRLTYTLVRQILVDKNAAIRRNHKPLLTPLKWMAELGTTLEKKRIGRGSMGFEIPEPFVEFRSNDTITAIKLRERNPAHKIIEEFMLAANEAVAETFTNRHFPALYRIHGSPDPVKVTAFAEFMQSLGYEVPRSSDSLSSKWFNNLINQTKGTTREYLISNLILRVMQQARYSPENVGHFGLAAPYYTHFTSPIRRYPDLMVHRSLKSLLWPNEGEKASKGNLHEAGEFLSKRERVAVDAEREMLDRLKVRFMENKIGETFAGIISGITPFGLFVELTDTMVNGGVAVEDLPRDSYEFLEKQYSLLGKHSGKRYQVGDLVTVRLIRVDIHSRKINFALSGDEQKIDPGRMSLPEKP